MVEDAEVGSGTNFKTRSAKNSPLNIAEDAEIGANGNSGDDKTVKKSPFKKLSRLTGYFTSLRFEKR